MHLLHLARMVEGYVCGLLNVLSQVMKHKGHREGIIRDLCGRCRPVDRQLECTFADGKRTIAVIVHDRLVKRLGACFSRQRPKKTPAVFGGMAVQPDVQHLCQGWDNIIEENRCWTSFARFDFLRPADEERYAVASLVQARLPAVKRSVAVVLVNACVAPDPSGPISSGAIDRSVVAGENNDRIPFDSEFGNPVQNSADMVIEFDDKITIRPGSAAPDEFLVGDDRVVRRCHRVIEEERLTGPGCALPSRRIHTPCATVWAQAGPSCGQWQ